MKTLSKIQTVLFFIVISGLYCAVTSCSKDENGGGGNGFSYTDIGPNLGSDWHMSDARRSDTGLWALYDNYEAGTKKLARYDFNSKQWQFWDFDNFIWDFDVWLEGEDNGNGAVVVEATQAGNAVVRSLSSAIEWDIEDIDQFKGHVALGWGSGSAAFSNWVGGHLSGHAVYQETGTCCPVEWNKIDILPGPIYDMWASSRQGGYVLATTADKSFVVYSNGGAEITFGGTSYALQNVAWDTQTGIPYALVDGILYRIEVNPNTSTAIAVAIADLTTYNYGVTFGISGLDIRSGHAYVSYGAVVELSNGSIRSSWIGETDTTNVDDLIIIQAIANSEMFTPPNDQDSVYAHVITADPNTFESYETWIRVNNAL